MPDQLFVGIDIGSTKFSTTVALGNRDGSVRYVGHGSSPASGIKAGEIEDQQELERGLNLALDEARQLSGAEIADIVVSVAGVQLKGISYQGQIALDSNYSITEADVDRALESAQAEISAGSQTIHRLVQGFTINGEPVRNPIGRTGNSLEVSIRDFAVSESLVTGIQQAAGAHGTRVHALVPGGVAAGEAVLRPDERQRGVILLDIGAASTDVALYVDGGLYDLGGIQLGGHHISRDLAMLLDVPVDKAEQLKSRYGVAAVQPGDDLGFEWGPRGIAMMQNQARNGTLSTSIPRAIAGARVEQILSQVREMLGGSTSRLQFHAGVVITGGASRMPGIDEVTRSILGLEARCGDILPCDGFPRIADPASSASIGLVRYCASRGATGKKQSAKSSREEPRETVPAGDHVHEMAQLEVQQSALNPFRRSDGQSAQKRMRPWGDVMREWVKEFIPARSDV